MAKKAKKSEGDPSRHRRGPSPWGVGTKATFLRRRYTTWLALGRQARGPFLDNVTNDFIAVYGMFFDIKTDLPVVPDDPEPGASVIDYDQYEPEERERAQAYTKGLRAKIGTWYREEHTRVTDTTKAFDISTLWNAHIQAQAQKKPSNALRLLHYYSLYHYDDRIKDRFELAWATADKEWKEKCAAWEDEGIPIPEDEKEPHPVAVRTKVTQECWAREPESFQVIVRQAHEQYKEDRRISREAPAPVIPDQPKTPEAYQQAINNAPIYLQPTSDTLASNTGLICAVLLCGPLPSEGGEIGMLSMHTGSTLGPHGLQWPDADRSGFAEVERILIKHAKKCFTKDQCLARALDNGAGSHMTAAPSISPSDRSVSPERQPLMRLIRGSRPQARSSSSLMQETPSERTPSPSRQGSPEAQLPSPPTSVPPRAVSPAPETQRAFMSPVPGKGAPMRTPPDTRPPPPAQSAPSREVSPRASSPSVPEDVVHGTTPSTSAPEAPVRGASSSPASVPGSREASPTPASVPGSREASPTPAFVPTSREASPSPASVPGSREASPTPAFVPTSREASPSPASVPGSREASPTPAFVPTSREASPSPASVPGSREASPTPVSPMPAREESPASDAPAPECQSSLEQMSPITHAAARGVTPPSTFSPSPPSPIVPHTPPPSPSTGPPSGLGITLDLNRDQMLVDEDQSPQRRSPAPHTPRRTTLVDDEDIEKGRSHPVWSLRSTGRWSLHIRDLFDALHRARTWGFSFASAVDTFLQLEDHLDYPRRDDGRPIFAGSLRPSPYSIWARQGASYYSTVDIGDIDAFGRKFWLWWEALQPVRRVNPDGGLIAVEDFEGIIGGMEAWDGLDKCCGKDGLIQVLLLLLWWGDAINDGAGIVRPEQWLEWDMAVQDFRGILSLMMRTPGFEKVARKRARHRLTANVADKTYTGARAASSSKASRKRKSSQPGDERRAKRARGMKATAAAVPPSSSSGSASAMTLASSTPGAATNAHTVALGPGRQLRDRSTIVKTVKLRQ